MRHVPAFQAISLAVLLGATSGAGAHESSTYIQGLQDSLVEHAASDFAAGHLQPGGFRNVELRYRENDHGARTYMLCGQVRMGIGAKEDWVDFATIKTDPYEQWLGGSATDMCARSVTVPSDVNDLSAALRTKLGNPLNIGKP
jgi:hypothetical protein